MLEAKRISQIGMTEERESGHGQLYTDISNLWRFSRLGKITASKAWTLMAPKGFGDTGMSYIRSRVYEKIAKVSSDREINTIETISGLVEEGHSLQLFMVKHKIENKLFRVQKLVYGEDDSYSCTPDGIWIKNVYEKDGQNIFDVSTVESKSYSPERHIACVECTTPAEIREVDFKAYCQTIDQMIDVNCLTGYLVYFNSAMDKNKGGYREIEFRSAIDKQVRDDIKLLNTRKLQAKSEIERIYNKLTQAA